MTFFTHSNGRTLSVGGAGGFELWDVITGQRKFKHQMRDQAVFCLCFSPDGRSLAIGSGPYSAMNQTGNTIASAAAVAVDIAASLHGVNIPGGKNQDLKGKLELWDVEKQKADKFFFVWKGNSFLDFGTEFTISCLAFQCEGKLLAAGDNRKNIKFCDPHIKGGSLLNRSIGSGASGYDFSSKIEMDSDVK